MDDEEIVEGLYMQALALHEEGHNDEALALYHQALELDFEWPIIHYNIGLIHKYRSEWQESLRYNRHAVEFDPDDEASNWNLAIAATALKDWRTAREVWHRLGMQVELGDTPIASDFGMTPVRLNPEGNAEVVWARRIDPVRARIDSIPYAESGYCHGDIVLHDGAAVGYREYDGREYPVFNVLELFQPSDQNTYEIALWVTHNTDVADLLELLRQQELAAEDWSRSVRILCKQCSEGTPHEHHDAEQVESNEQAPQQQVAVASPDETHVRHVLAQWSNDARGMLRLEQVLSAGTRNAGGS